MGVVLRGQTEDDPLSLEENLAPRYKARLRYVRARIKETKDKGLRTLMVVLPWPQMLALILYEEGYSVVQKHKCKNGLHWWRISW
jgi:hypothetical protein